MVDETFLKKIFCPSVPPCCNPKCPPITVTPSESMTPTRKNFLREFETPLLCGPKVNVLEVHSNQTAVQT